MLFFIGFLFKVLFVDFRRELFFLLKPCPRCGGKGKAVDVYPTDSIVGDTIATAFAIQCTKCNALGKHTQQIQLPLDAKILIDALLKLAAIYWNFGLMSD